jgi:branched-chain amino acid transport system permease protein
VAATIDRRSTRLSWPKLFAIGVTTAFTVFVAVNFWNPSQTVDSDKIILFVIVGITLSAIYAMAAAGLVVTYTTSGIFNFAQGAIGMILTYTYWQLKVAWGIQTLLALLLTVLVAAPILGALIERILMRRLVRAPLVAQLVATVGLLAFFVGLADTVWPSDTYRSIGQFYGADKIQIGTTFIPWYRIITIVVGVIVAIALWALLHKTRVGVAMRAVVDNRDLAALNGARPGMLSMLAWALGSSMAAIAGIFLAMDLGQLSSQGLTFFIVDAFAAAIIARLRSLPMTLVGGAVIGFSLSFQRNFLDLGQRWSPAQIAIPSIILFLALLFVPQARIEGRRIGRAIVARVPSLKRAATGFLALFVVIAVLAAALDRVGVRRVEIAMILAFGMLSLVPLTGWAGQISFAQITFMGIGAWAATEFSNSGGAVFGVHLYPTGSPLGLLAAVIVVVPIGLLMALPALRLQGLYLALASMAFALMAVPLFFDQPEVFASSARYGAPIGIFGFHFNEPFSVLGIDFGTDAGFLLLTTALFGIVGFGVVALRRGAFGRRLIALRDSPAACATLGVNLRATKVAVFGISAGIAGFAGALFAVAQGSAQATDFTAYQGLPLLLLLVVGGVAVVSGAVLGGFLLQGFTVWLTAWFPNVTVLEWWQRMGPGLAGIGISRQPDGIIPQVGQDFRDRRQRSKARQAPTAAPTPPPAARPAPSPAQTPVAKPTG